MLSITREVNDLSLFDDTRKFGNSKKNAALNGESCSGYSLRTVFEKQSRNHYFTFTYVEVDPTFQSHIGFINRIDRRMAEAEAGYIIYNDSSFAERINLFINHGSDFTYNGIRKDQWVFIGSSVTLPGQTNVFIGTPLLSREFYKGRDFKHLSKIHTNLNTSLSKHFDLYFSGSFGRNIYRDDPPQLGTGHEFGTGLTFKPEPRFVSSIDFSKAGLKNVAGDDVFYDGYIFRLTAYYLYSKEAQFRLISEYDSFSRAIYFYPLFSYKLNPFTIFYTGTTQDYKDYGNEINYKKTAMSYFVKLQYLWSNL